MSDESSLPTTDDEQIEIDNNVRIGDPENAAYWLGAIVETADDAIVTKSLEGTITSWNRGAERIFGYTSDEAIGQPVSMLIPEEFHDEEPSIIAKLRRGERIDHYETVRVRKDGSRVDISLTVSPIRGEGGKIIGASKIVRDISDRRRVERELREQSEIIETVNRVGQLLAAELDLEKLVQAATDAATEISGASFGAFFYNVIKENNESYMLYTLSGVPRSSFANFPMPRNTAIFAPTFEGTGTVILDDVTKDPRYGKNSPYRGMPAGHLPVKSYLAVPVVSRSGDVMGGLFFGHPEPGVFTERVARIIEGLASQAAVAMDNARLFETAQRARREAEASAAENDRLYREAQESSRLKDEFLAIISHEVRTPLTAILGWAQMLRSSRLSGDEAAKALEIIERNALAQTHIIEDLLDVSRIITGKLRLDLRRIDPTAFIEEAIQSVTPAAQAKGIRVQKILDTGLISVSGDPVRLQQVVWNLLSNAIKFTPKGGRVQIRLERVNSHLEINVSDTGEGFASDFAPHLFDRFRQEDQKTTRKYGGLGLGLAIVRHIVEMHGGTVQAASEGLGRGASFTVMLPVISNITVEPDQRVHPTGRVTIPLEDSPIRLEGINILVVDDEADTRSWLKAGLESHGASVAAAGSADEAIESISVQIPDVLISDIGMPLADGYELIKRLRQQPSDQGGRLPAIALTAYARAEDRLRALRAGYQMHVAKPVELTELITVVASLMHQFNWPS